VILLEKTRNQLVSDSKNVKKERDGQTRYQKRLKSRIGSSVKEYNSMNMNKLFKDNILDVNIQVYGETDNYIVTLSFGGILDELKTLLRSGKQLELRDIVRALTASFNKDNVYIHCSCPDWRYRFAYFATKRDINAGNPELRPSDITNPNDDLGDGCKHVMLVLNNTSWIIKTASVITNYVKFMEKNQKRLYADIIYPAIYGKKYEEPVQMDLFNNDELETDEQTLDKSNEYARTKNQFKPGNEYRYQKQEKEDGTIPLDIEGENNAWKESKWKLW